MGDDSATDSGRTDPSKAGVWRRGSHRVLSILTVLRTLAIDLVILAFVGGILWVTISDLRGDQIVIEEIPIPETATKRGYSGQVASLRLWDAMQRIIDETAERTDFKGGAPLQTASEQLEITEPESGLSLRGLSQLVRKVLRIEQRRIAGEFVCGDVECSPARVALRLRVFKDGRVHRIQSPRIGDAWSEQDLDKYFKHAALEALRVVEPMVVAEYLNAKYDKDAYEVAMTVVATDPEHAARAATLLVQFYGNSAILQDKNDNLEKAYRWEGRLLELAPADETYWRGIALTSLGWTQKSLGETGVAERHFAEALDIFKHYRPARSVKPLILQWTGSALMGMDEYRLASETFEVLAGMEPNNPGALMSWGWALYELGESEDAEEKYEQALMAALFKEYVHLDWADTLYQEKSYAAAINHYEEAIKLNPGLADAYFWLGVSHLNLSLGNIAEAGPHLRTYSVLTKTELEESWEWALLQVISRQD